MSAFLLHSNEPTVDLLLPRLGIEHGSTLPAKLHEDKVVIHWGAFHPDRGQAEVLQPVKSIVLAQNRSRAAAVLRLHGIDAVLETTDEDRDNVDKEDRLHQCFDQRNGKASQGKERWTHEFVIPIFHLQPLTLYHRQSLVLQSAAKPGSVVVPGMGSAPKLVEIGKEQPTYHGARAMREAVKALYALGLDYGVVGIGVRSDASMAVLKVEPVPRLNDRLAELFAEAINRFEQEMAVKLKRGTRHTVMLGADPEFVLRNERGKVEFASKYVGKDGLFGCDAIVLRSFRKIYPLAELRPRPSTDVRQLVINLHRTMQLAARTIDDPKLEWLAGGMPVRGFPLGGHIHFSGVPLTSSLLRALDNYLALPLVLIEDPTTGVRKPKYGFLGDFRRQRYGGSEYRVLPSWMVSPVITKGVLALAKLIAENYRELKRRPLDEPEVTKAYYKGDKERIRKLLLPLWRDLEQLPDYRACESYVNPLRRRLMLMQPWNEHGDIRKSWKIPPYS